MPETTKITLKVSGSLLDAADIDTLADALGQCPKGCQIVLVHGGGPQLDEALAKLEEPLRRHRGLRITSRGQAGIVQATLDAVGSRLCKGLEQRGIPAEHVDSLQHRLVAKKKDLADGVDLGRVGTPVRFHADPVLRSDPSEDATVNIITPVGTDGTGPLNVNADEAAAAIAEATGSQALVFATSVPGVLDETGHPIEVIDPPDARRLVEEGIATGGMQPKLEAGLSALAEGVDSVHVAALTDSLLADALAERVECGTCITREQEAIV